MNFNPLAKNREWIINKCATLSYSGSDFASWQNEGRAKLRELLGMPCFEVCDPEFKCEIVEERDGYNRLMVTYATEKNFYISSNLLMPNGAEKCPLVISIYGDSEDLEAALGDGADDRDVAISLVKRGYAVLLLETRSFNDCPGVNSKRVPITENIRATWNECYRATMRANILGRVTAGERVWDISRSIDCILANFEKVDADNIIVMGNSGGATVAYYAQAIDTRISRTICSSGITNWEDTFTRVSVCSCNFIPYIANYFKIGDIAGLILPRKVDFISYSEDEWYTPQYVERVYRYACDTFGNVNKDFISLTAADGIPLLRSSLINKLI